jgi:bacillithiol system protein YtxJ
MGLLNKLFRGTTEPKEEKVLPWIPLNSLGQLSLIEKNSYQKTQIIFKYSTRCGISKMVMNQFIDSYDLNNNVDLYYLDLLSYREVSNEAGYKFQVIHESPQVLIIKNGATMAHASHGAINALQLGKFV